MTTNLIKALCAIVVVVCIVITQINGLKIHLHEELSPSIILGQKQNLTFVFTDIDEEMFYNMPMLTLRPYYKSNYTNMLSLQVPGFTFIHSVSEQISTIFDTKYPSCHLQAVTSNQLIDNQHIDIFTERYIGYIMPSGSSSFSLFFPITFTAAGIKNHNDPIIVRCEGLVIIPRSPGTPDDQRFILPKPEFGEENINLHLDIYYNESQANATKSDSNGYWVIAPDITINNFGSLIIPNATILTQSITTSTTNNQQEDDDYDESVMLYNIDLTLQSTHSNMYYWLYLPFEKTGLINTYGKFHPQFNPLTISNPTGTHFVARLPFSIDIYSQQGSPDYGTKCNFTTPLVTNNITTVDVYTTHPFGFMRKFTVVEIFVLDNTQPIELKLVTQTPLLQHFGFLARAPLFSSTGQLNMINSCPYVEASRVISVVQFDDRYPYQQPITVWTSPQPNLTDFPLYTTPNATLLKKSTNNLLFTPQQQDQQPLELELEIPLPKSRAQLMCTLQTAISWNISHRVHQCKIVIYNAIEWGLYFASNPNYQPQFLLNLFYYYNPNQDDTLEQRLPLTILNYNATMYNPYVQNVFTNKTVDGFNNVVQFMLKPKPSDRHITISGNTHHIETDYFFLPYFGKDAKNITWDIDFEMKIYKDPLVILRYAQNMTEPLIPLTTSSTTKLLPIIDTLSLTLEQNNLEKKNYDFAMIANNREEIDNIPITTNMNPFINYTTSNAVNYGLRIIHKRPSYNIQYYQPQRNINLEDIIQTIKNTQHYIPTTQNNIYKIDDNIPLIFTVPEILKTTSLPLQNDKYICGSYFNYTQQNVTPRQYFTTSIKLIQGEIYTKSQLELLTSSQWFSNNTKDDFLTENYASTRDLRLLRQFLQNDKFVVFKLPIFNEEQIDYIEIQQFIRCHFDLTHLNNGTRHEHLETLITLPSYNIIYESKKMNLYTTYPIGSSILRAIWNEHQINKTGQWMSVGRSVTINGIVPFTADVEKQFISSIYPALWTVKETRHWSTVESLFYDINVADYFPDLTLDENGIPVNFTLSDEQSQAINTIVNEKLELIMSTPNPTYISYEEFVETYDIIILSVEYITNNIELTSLYVSDETVFDLPFIATYPIIAPKTIITFALDNKYSKAATMMMYHTTLMRHGSIQSVMVNLAQNDDFLLNLQSSMNHHKVNQSTPLAALFWSQSNGVDLSHRATFNSVLNLSTRIFYMEKDACLYREPGTCGTISTGITSNGTIVSPCPTIQCAPMLNMTSLPPNKEHECFVDEDCGDIENVYCDLQKSRRCVLKKSWETLQEEFHQQYIMPLQKNNLLRNTLYPAVGNSKINATIQFFEQQNKIDKQLIEYECSSLSALSGYYCKQYPLLQRINIISTNATIIKTQQQQQQQPNTNHFKLQQEQQSKKYNYAYLSSNDILSIAIQYDGKIGNRVTFGLSIVEKSLDNDNDNVINNAKQNETIIYNKMLKTITLDNSLQYVYIEIPNNIPSVYTHNLDTLANNNNNIWEVYLDVYIFVLNGYYLEEQRLDQRILLSTPRVDEDGNNLGISIERSNNSHDNYNETKLIFLASCQQVKTTATNNDSDNDIEIISRCANNGICDILNTGTCNCTNDNFISEDFCTTTKCFKSFGCDIDGTQSCDYLQNICICKSTHQGKYCQELKQSIEPEPSQQCLKVRCLNNGYQKSCMDHRCVCVNDITNSFWSGDTCSRCILQCHNGGKVNKNCNQCICPAGFIGPTCNCNAKRLIFTFTNPPLYTQIVNQYFNLAQSTIINETDPTSVLKVMEFKDGNDISIIFTQPTTTLKTIITQHYNTIITTLKTKQEDKQIPPTSSSPSSVLFNSLPSLDLLLECISLTKDLFADLEFKIKSDLVQLTTSYDNFNKQQLKLTNFNIKNNQLELFTTLYTGCTDILNNDVTNFTQSTTTTTTTTSTSVHIEYQDFIKNSFINDVMTNSNSIKISSSLPATIGLDIYPTLLNDRSTGWYSYIANIGQPSQQGLGEVHYYSSQRQEQNVFKLQQNDVYNDSMNIDNVFKFQSMRISNYTCPTDNNSLTLPNSLCSYISPDAELLESSDSNTAVHYNQYILFHAVIVLSMILYLL